MAERPCRVVDNAAGLLTELLGSDIGDKLVGVGEVKTVQVDEIVKHGTTPALERRPKVAGSYDGRPNGVRRITWERTETAKSIGPSHSLIFEGLRLQNDEAAVNRG